MQEVANKPRCSSIVVSLVVKVEPLTRSDSSRVRKVDHGQDEEEKGFRKKNDCQDGQN